MNTQSNDGFPILPPFPVDQVPIRQEMKPGYKLLFEYLERVERDCFQNNEYDAQTKSAVEFNISVCNFVRHFPAADPFEIADLIQPIYDFMPVKTTEFCDKLRLLGVFFEVAPAEKHRKGVAC